MDVSLESKALTLLENYEGGNNYILELKRKSQINKKFYPTRSQSEYIVNNHNKQPKVARKWVVLDAYFAKKLADDKLYTEIPEKVWVEKLLCEKDKAYHIWGKVFDNEQLHDFWLPKAAVIKDNTVKDVVIDYSKYSHRPPLDHQKEAIQKLVENKKFILADDMGLGKCEYVKNEVFTPTGRKKIGDLKVGDKVIGSDGKSHNVIGVYPQGIKETYRITFNDGFSILVGDEHLWSVSSPNYGKNRKNERRKKSLVLSTKQMYEGGKITIKGDGYNKEKIYEIETYYKSSNGNNKWQIPIVQPIQFERNDNLPIDPYLLGLILGDGHLTKSSCVFTVHSDDYDELFGGFDLKENKQIGNKRKGNKFIGRDILCDLKLNESRSQNKFIPEIYKYSSIENRLSILQGLMDTDGCCMFNKQKKFLGTEYSTISKQLCDDIVEIVQTLGGIARVKSRIPVYTYKGEKKKGQLSYRVNIKLPKGMNPFRLKRKANKYVDPTKYPTGRYIKNIEKVGFEESVCISVDAPDKLYVTEHAIVTHNTTSTIIAALETGAKKVLIICPATLKINWKREIENYSDRPVYIAESKKFSTEHDFVIANYDIIKNFHDPKKKDESLISMSKFDLVIADECFTYDTKIMTEYGEMNIGDIVEYGLNVKILSFNHDKQKIEYKKINRWIRKNKDTIYKIKFNNGLVIECTDNHKFYVNNKGYVRAKDLKTTDDLYMLSKTIDKKTDLEKGEMLFKKLCINNKKQITPTKTKREKISKSLSSMWEYNEIYNREKNDGKNILYNKMFEQGEIKQSGSETKKKRNNRTKWGMVRTYEKGSYEKPTHVSINFCENEDKQSNVQSGKFGKNETKTNWKNIYFKGWKRKNNNTSRNLISVIGGWMVNGITNYNQRLRWKFKNFTPFLQSGYWKFRIKNFNRNRWKYPQNKKMEIFRQKKNRNIEFVRVESVEILERGSYDKSTTLSSKNTRVYDLEIKDNHNYFANSILVSNCHMIKNPQAQRTKLINDIVKNIDRLWLLSGTPMTSRPMDYFNLLSLVDSPVAKNWMAYAIRYCAGYQFKVGNRKIWNVTGASNLEELRDRTKDLVLRRLKENVLDLPEKIITPVYLNLKSKLYEDVMGEYYDWYDKNPEESKSLTVQFTKLTKVRQIIADEKISQTIELAENIIEQGKKVIIFCNFTDSLNKIVEHFGKSAVKLDGSMPQHERQYSVDQFQTNEKIKVFVGNIRASGTGITLTSGDAVIFNDLSFLPSDMAQAEDRAYRYGQKNNVLVYYPIYQNTIENIIYDIVNNKKKVIATVMGDSVNESNTAEEILKQINHHRK